MQPSGMIVDGRLFLPTGQSYFGSVGEEPRPNPGHRGIDWSKRRPIYEATLFVGFNVRNDAPIDMFCLMAMVHDLLQKRETNASSSFIAQHGIWQLKQNLRADFEESASVRILAGRSVGRGSGAQRWSATILDVAEEIATVARQQVVLVQFSLNGAPVELLRVKSSPDVTGLPSLEEYRHRGEQVRALIGGTEAAPSASPRRGRR